MSSRSFFYLVHAGQARQVRTSVINHKKKEGRAATRLSLKNELRRYLAAALIALINMPIPAAAVPKDARALTFEA